MKTTKKKAIGFLCIAYAAMWISVSVAVIAGLIITNSAWCLWAFLIPGSLKLKLSDDLCEDEES